MLLFQYRMLWEDRSFSDSCFPEKPQCPEGGSDEKGFPSGAPPAGTVPACLLRPLAARLAVLTPAGRPFCWSAGAHACSSEGASLRPGFCWLSGLPACGVPLCRGNLSVAPGLNPSEPCCRPVHSPPFDTRWGCLSRFCVLSSRPPGIHWSGGLPFSSHRYYLIDTVSAFSYCTGFSVPLIFFNSS